jgi:hypothetical protein
MFHAWESGERCTQQECICTTSREFSNMRTCVAGCNCAVGLILTPIWCVTFCSPQFTRDRANNTWNSHLWDRDNPHGTVETYYQHRFSVNVWCGVIGDQRISPYILPQRLTVDIYANVLQDVLPALLENVPLQTRRLTYYQHEGAPPHFSQAVRQYLNNKFPYWLIGRGGTQNCPPRSPDLNSLDYRVWGYMKAMVYACKLNTRELLLQRIFSAARSIKNAAVLRKVTNSVVTRFRSCIQADGGHYEWRAWVSERRICNCTFNNIFQ